MSKTKNQKHTIIHPHLETLGAIALTLVSGFVSFETIIEHHTHNTKDSNHSKRDTEFVNQIFARGEAKGETARLPEEFDIGLQTPRIAGL